MGMLAGFVRKASLFLPPAQRSVINQQLQSKQKPNLLLEKTKIIILCILAAKQHKEDNAFIADIQEAVGTLNLSEAEHALFDGFLGGKQGMLMEYAKKGVSKERLNLIRAELDKQRTFNIN